MRNFVGIWLLGLVLTSTTATEAQPAPAPATDCSSLILNMADCLSFVTSGSTVQNPQGTCCDGLKQVLNTDGECLCEVLKNSAELGVTLNVTKALSLPAVCRVSNPSVSQCGLLAPSPSSVPPAPTPGTSGSLAVSASSGMMAIAISCFAMF